MAGLGALAELDLDHLDLRLGRLAGEEVRVEVAVLGAAAEIAGGHLPDDVAAMLAVIGADRALAGVVGEAAQLGAQVEGHDGVGADRAETGAGDVQHRGRIGLAAIGSADGDAEVVVGRRLRPDGVGDPAIADGAHVLDGAEGLGVVNALGPAIDQGAVLAAERHRVALVLDDVLAQLRPDRFQHEADVADDRIVAQDGVVRLEDVGDADQEQRDQHHQRQGPPGAEPDRQPCERQGQNADKLEDGVARKQYRHGVRLCVAGFLPRTCGDSKSLACDA